MTLRQKTSFARESHSGGFTQGTIDTWLGQGFSKMRKPDVFETSGGGAVAGYMRGIWYGPAGAGGDVATETIWDSGFFYVSEYQNIAGYFDVGTYDASTPFLKHTAGFSLEAVLKALRDAGFLSRRIRGGPVVVVKKKNILLWATSLGIAELAYLGGKDAYVDSLPRKGGAD